MTTPYQRFQEKIIVPVLVAGMLGVAGWMVQIDRSVASNGKEIEFSEEQKAEIKKLLEAAQATQGALVKQQHEIEKQLIELQINQKGFQEDVGDIKQQTQQILDAVKR